MNQVPKIINSYKTNNNEALGSVSTVPKILFQNSVNKMWKKNNKRKQEKTRKKEQQEKMTKRWKQDKETIQVSSPRHYEQILTIENLNSGQSLLSDN